MLTLAGLRNTQRFQQSNVLLSFASAQKINAKAMTPEEIQKEYAENIATVCAYTTSIQNLSINILVAPVPKWYNEEFKKKFIASKANAAKWTNDIMYLLKEVPESIIDYDDLYKSNADDIIDYCEKLKKVYSEDVADKLTKSIEKLVKGVTQKKNLINNVINLLDSYITTLGKDNDFFENTYKSACKDIDADTKQLEEFEKKKKELEKEIKHCQDVILGTGISGAVALAAAPVGLAFGPIGIIIGVIAFVAALALLITAIAESEICAQKEAELSLIAGEMNDMTKAIYDSWDALEEQMKDLIANINECDEKAASKLYDEIIEEIKKENGEWDKIVASAKNYANINIEVKKEVQQIYKSA